jgi:hypothetical protein
MNERYLVYNALISRRYDPNESGRFLAFNSLVTKMES